MSVSQTTRVDRVTSDVSMAVSVRELSTRYRSRQMSPVEFTRALLERLESVDVAIHAYVAVAADRAIDAASRAERQLLKGTSTNALVGVPVAIKDVFDTENLTTTAGSRVLANNVPSSDATVVARLRAAGAVIIGKTNTDEFALGGTTQNPHYGGTRNPWNRDHNPGGSSGGSAAALASLTCVAAVGTDTAGSVRAPAAACGVVGLKPTYGRVPLTGVFPVSWTLDHAGPMTRTVEDAAIMLNAMAGYDAADPHSVDIPSPDYTSHLALGTKGLRIGVVELDAAGEDQPEVVENYRRAVDVLEELGAHIRPVEVPSMLEARRVLGIIVEAEAAEHHRTLFGRYAHLYSDQVRQRIESGQHTSGETLTRAYVDRHRLIATYRALMADLDALVLPAAASTAPRIGEDIPRDLLYRYFAPFSLTGAPVVVVPTGTDLAGLPTSMQIVGRSWDEATILRLAYGYEQAAPWNQRWPAIEASSSSPAMNPTPSKAEDRL